MFNIYGGASESGGTTIDPGTVTGQTAVWDGSKWIPTSDIFIDASGNVGIADITPTGRFSIEDDGTALGSVMDVYMDDGNLWGIRIYNRTYGVAAANPFRFFMNNAGVFQFLAPVDLILSAGNDGTFGNGIVLKASNDAGFGIALPLAKVHIVKTTEQLRIGYDATNYVGLAVDSAGTLTFDLNGTKRWAMGGTSFNSSVTAQGPALLAATPTATAPNIRPNQSDVDTGFGWAGADQISLITGGVEGMRIVEDTTISTHIPETATPTAIPNYGSVYPKTDNRLYFQDGAGVEHLIHGFPTFKSYTVTTQGLGANPDIYAAGYLDYSATDANLTNASTTVTIGTANISYAAHAFVVAGGAGTTDGSDLVLTVTGTSITDSGTRTPGDSEIVVADCTTSTTDLHYETVKKWLGQITFTLSSTAGGTFAYDFNYGLAKYEDFSDFDFIVDTIEVVGLAGANDTDINVTLMHYNSVWTYAASGFDPIIAGNTIASLVTDHATDDQTLSGSSFAWKRIGLATAVAGSGGEGVIIRVVSSANNAIEFCNIHLGVNF